LIVNTQYRTSTALHDLDDLDDLRSSGEGREISLGTAAILGIFLALALICAAFFGFGYSLGRRSAPPVAPSATDSAATPISNGAKPAPGSLAPSPKAAPDDNIDTAQASDPDPSAKATKTVSFDPAPDPAPSTPATPPAKPALTPAIARTTPISTPISAAAATTSGAATVQVAAVSHQEDADVLLSALKKRGYSVAIHHEPQDKLLHVQIGPFASKKDAEAMRQRLLADGYNAIVK
jgi:DedD protein